MMKISLCLAALLVSCGSLAQASEPEGARGFVLGVFRAEASPGFGVGKHPGFKRFLSRRLGRAIERDSKKGEIGVLDHDPICMCQDSEGLHFSILKMDATPKGLVVEIKTHGQFAKWLLVREAGHWVIADIFEINETNGGSVLSTLEHGDTSSH